MLKNKRHKPTRYSTSAFFWRWSHLSSFVFSLLFQYRSFKNLLHIIRYQQYSNLLLVLLLLVPLNAQAIMKKCDLSADCQSDVYEDDVITQDQYPSPYAKVGLFVLSETLLAGVSLWSAKDPSLFAMVMLGVAVNDITDFSSERKFTSDLFSLMMLSAIAGYNLSQKTQTAPQWDIVLINFTALNCWVFCSKYVFNNKEVDDEIYFKLMPGFDSKFQDVRLRLKMDYVF